MSRCQKVPDVKGVRGVDLFLLLVLVPVHFLLLVLPLPLYLFLFIFLLPFPLRCPFAFALSFPFSSFRSDPPKRVSSQSLKTFFASPCRRISESATHIRQWRIHTSKQRLQQKVHATQRGRGNFTRTLHTRRPRSPQKVHSCGSPPEPPAALKEREKRCEKMSDVRNGVKISDVRR